MHGRDHRSGHLKQIAENRNDLASMAFSTRLLIVAETRSLRLLGNNRGVAQLVAHLLWEQGVARSNRVAPTNGKR